MTTANTGHTDLDALADDDIVVLDVTVTETIERTAVVSVSASEARRLLREVDAGFTDFANDIACETDSSIDVTVDLANNPRRNLRWRLSGNEHYDRDEHA